MLLAEVVGSVVATVKDEGLHARTLLLLQPLSAAGAPTGSVLIAVDGCGVGVGERVFYVRGREAAFAFLPDLVPADASIVGKVDAVEVGRSSP
jgi:microcompartment protein CcmK/EutM